MGIKDLLQNLKSIQRRVHISKYSDQPVGIDSYCWLHKGLYNCAMDFIKHGDISKLLKYLQGKIKLLRKYRIKPIFVFDGAPLKIKQKTNFNRAELRSKARQEADGLYKLGKYDLAARKYAESASVTPQMIEAFIKMLQEQDIDYIVAPYEADAQLAYLSLNELVACVMTQDSDLLVYGCKQAVYKVDNDGYGDLICMDDLENVKELSLHTFTFDMFVVNCIMAGCDYLPNIKGIGFKKAHQLVKKHKGEIEPILKDIKLEKKHSIPDNYEKSFTQAYLTFKFQRVYCPLKEKVVHLHDPLSHKYGHFLDKFEDLEFLGASISDSMAGKIAKGEVHATGKRWSVVKADRLKREQEKQKQPKENPFRTFSIAEYAANQETENDSPERFQPTLQVSDSMLDTTPMPASALPFARRKSQKRSNSRDKEKIQKPQLNLDSFIYRTKRSKEPEKYSLPSSYEQIGSGREAVREMKNDINEKTWSGNRQFLKSENVLSEYERFKKEMASKYGIVPSVRESQERKYEGGMKLTEQVRTKNAKVLLVLDEVEQRLGKIYEEE